MKLSNIMVRRLMYLVAGQVKLGLLSDMHKKVVQPAIKVLL
jgi:hypothetical protein